MPRVYVASLHNWTILSIRKTALGMAVDTGPAVACAVAAPKACSRMNVQPGPQAMPTFQPSENNL
ncbi:MAG: hypothetical protein ABJA76_04360 [Mucilaginibacter sp.]